MVRVYKSLNRVTDDMINKFRQISTGDYLELVRYCKTYSERTPYVDERVVFVKVHRVTLPQKSGFLRGEQFGQIEVELPDGSVQSLFGYGDSISGSLVSVIDHSAPLEDLSDSDIMWREHIWRHLGRDMIRIKERMEEVAQVREKERRRREEQAYYRAKYAEEQRNKDLEQQRKNESSALEVDKMFRKF